LNLKVHTFLVPPSFQKQDPENNIQTITTIIFHQSHNCGQIADYHGQFQYICSLTKPCARGKNVGSFDIILALPTHVISWTARKGFE